MGVGVGNNCIIVLLFKGNGFRLLRKTNMSTLFLLLSGKESSLKGKNYTDFQYTYTLQRNMRKRLLTSGQVYITLP